MVVWEVSLLLKSPKALTSILPKRFRLKNMETSLPQESFMRVHRSYIVNLKRIASYTKGRIFLDNGEYIPLGENYKEAFLERFDK